MIEFHDDTITGGRRAAALERVAEPTRPVMTGERARQVDIGRLPDDVVALVDALGPGENLVLTRDGLPVAAISSAGPRPGPPRTDDADVTVVATAMKLSASARRALSAELGPDYVVLDPHSAPATADVLLVPPVSPQLIGNLRAKFPKARVVLAEVEDTELGISYHGPVRRLLDAGAETYLTSANVPHLARQLDHTVAQRQQLGRGATAPLEISPGT
ncbi:hypothetical protein [Amycolatopsis echigonensis]|uniref:Uncharacterized protein n=2 Tax=Amycolatopsis echigonensis TaxID=2576905 RepID=A0A2N3WMW1_9PSEU|nr:hypothetical protein [Amycolatopsis echigonensis]PKV95210.1 hypothetical protein ATK30_6115 [Amycolatopsis niigatensis]